ncbi:Uncharacterised protein [[Clostridium] sordellii]|uniref:hypothetical protein n=1 Tax=Paraclostridium sordellii TaxID=1505 RepID=UPI0005DE3462|nr:hypothetical protein [Paeniclostridium sordellii]CEP90271.1 Uncharacterised protein [[Clostridium] sordellii] [Paeniclostridium sordellii]
MNYKKCEIESKDILPTWDSIFRQIDLIREEAKNIKLEQLDRKIPYHNNISILGGRGSGKTSLLMNLGTELNNRSENKSDIIFDIITPDIKDKEDVLGWIISLVIKRAKEIDSSNKTYYKKICYNCENITKIDKCIYELKQSYFFRKSIHEKVIANDYSSRIDYLNDNEEKLNADVDLKHNFSNLIDEIIEVQSKIGNCSPLLIFMFDDVDIHSSKINEVLSIIMVYLSHSNIVNIIAGDYESALENITLKMLKDDSILNRDLMNEKMLLKEGRTLKKVREDRAYDFLKKILPPKYRHHIPKFSNEKKYEISKQLIKQSECRDTEGYKIIKEVESFIHYYPIGLDKPVVLYDYMSFLDSNIRGLVNVIDFILINISDEEFNENDKFNFLEELLSVIIASNKEFSQNENIIEDIINLSAYNRNSFEMGNNGLIFNGYINYYAILSDIENNNGGVLSEYEFEKYYSIFMLANIFEIFIVALKLRETDKKTDADINKLHGLSELITILNKIRNDENIRLLPNINDILDNKTYIQENICIKQNIFKSLRYKEVQQLFKEKNSGYLESVYIDRFTHKGNVINYLMDVFDKDREWSENIINWIIDSAPTSNMIEKNIIKQLEDKYKHTIGTKYYKTLELKIDNDQSRIINKKYIDIMNYINVYIQWRYNFKNAINTKKEIELEEKKEKEKVNSMVEDLQNKNYKSYDDFTYNHIYELIQKSESFVENELNKEVWSQIKSKLIFIDEATDEMNMIEDLIMIDMKSELKKINIESEFVENIKEEYIAIKLNGPKDDKSIDFIKNYHINSRTASILKEHPVIEYKKLLEYKDSVMKDIENIEKQVGTINAEIETLKRDISGNYIYIYISERSGYKEHYEIKDEDIKKYILECIEISINKYAKENNVASIENRLDYFYDYIKELKNIDDKIVLNLSSSSLRLSKEQIEYYKSQFNSIKDGIRIIDIKNIEENIIPKNRLLGSNNINWIKQTTVQKELIEPNDLKKNLNLKLAQMNDETFKLKKDVLEYGFYRTLNIYLEQKLDYEHKQLHKKVRTEYLVNKTSELEELCKKDSTPTSFKSYLKFKFN